MKVMKEFEGSMITASAKTMVYEDENELYKIDMDYGSLGATTTTGGTSKQPPTSLGSGSVFLIASDGKMLSLPIPSESPDDPLSWGKKRRVFIFALLVLYSCVPLFLLQTPGNLVLGFMASFDEAV